MLEMMHGINRPSLVGHGTALARLLAGTRLPRSGPSITPGSGGLMARFGGRTRMALALGLGASLMAMTQPAGAAGPTIGGCSILPVDNIWNARVDGLPVAASSAAWVSTIGTTRHMHPDFGAGMWDGGPIGIPFVTVPGDQ